MKKLYFILLLTSIFFAQPVLGQISLGDGSAGNPFQISSAEHLNDVRNYLGDETTEYYFLQTANIDLSGYTNWVPIGGGGTTDIFQGHYDGAGYTISNLTINWPSTPNVGLFGHIGPLNDQKTNSVSIKNVRLENINIKGARGTGSLVGRVTGNEKTLIESCYVITGTITGDAATGGLVGSNNSYVVSGSFDERKPLINKCFAHVEVFFSNNGSDNQKFGGLAGCNQKGRIANSYSRSTITVQSSGAAERVGGLAGCSDLKGDILNSYSMGLVTVSGNVTAYGGLLGSIGLVDPGTVTHSYWDTGTSGQSGSEGGLGRTTSQMQNQATFSGWDFANIWNIMEGETYPFLRDFDLSGFDIADPGVQTAGDPFEITITNAKDVGGKLLNASYSVTVTSNLNTEGTGSDGILVNNLDFAFTEGEAVIAGIVLKKADYHTLTVDIETILETKEQFVTVNPGQAFKLVIDQQPATPIGGNYDDNPAVLSTITVVSHDEFDNPSVVGLDGVQLVTAAIENDGSSGSNAVIGGTTQVDIQSGTATFDNINIDKEGEGYTLRFSSGSPVALQQVISDAFNIENIDDLSVFNVALADPTATIYEFLEFGLDITGALGSNGQAISGLVNVIVTSNVEGVIHNLDVDFTSGAAGLTLALETIGAQTLTVNVSSVKNDEAIIVTVSEDLSEFAVSVDPIQQYAAFPFDLSLTGAKYRDGGTITGLTNIMVVSSIDGVVYNDNADFDVTGAATITIALNQGIHNLAVSIDGVTHNEELTGLDIAANVSGFIVAEVVGDKTAGVGFNLEITEAKALDVLINGAYNVTVTSNQEDNEPFVFSNVAFTAGEGTVTGVVLAKAHQTDPLLTLQHTLTVVIQSIDDEELVNVNVNAAPASEMVITTQPVGVEGINAGTALGIGNVVVETRDVFGNPSVSGLGESQDVTASIANDASAEGNATLGGNKTIDIQTGTATFSNLTLDRDGLGYTIQFASTGFGPVVSDPFDMTKVENHIGFDLVDPGPQVVGENFTVRLINARYPDGTLRNGSYEVFIVDGAAFRILFNQSIQFVDGSVLLTTTNSYGNTGLRNTLFRVATDEDSQKFVDITVSATDQSVFAITSPGTQTAGTPFNLNITGAKNKAGVDLNGRKHYVTLTSDNLDEGVDGVLFSDSLTFTGGAATIENVQLFDTVSKNLTVTIDWVTDPVTVDVILEPAAATQFVIHQQPVGGDGSNNDVAVGVGEIILHFMDDHGNISDKSLDVTLTVSANVSIGTTGATLGGINPVSIVNGVATFTDLTLDLNGAYTLGFTYNGFAPSFAPLVSSSFNMTNIENLEGFDVAHPGKQYQDLPFDLNITNAQDSAGVSLNGPINVTVTSDKADGEVFNEGVTFTEGDATVTISLNTVAADHNLTVSIAGIDPSSNVVVENVIVAADLSEFTLKTDPDSEVGPFYQDNPFDLVISDATDLDGVSISGSLLVTVTSDQADGVVHNEEVNFESGGVSIPITLATVFNSHSLTIDIAGVTDNKQVSVNVQSNQSGFDLALAEAGDKIAGVSFDIDITNANNLAGTALDGSGYQVIVTNDLSVEVYNNTDVTFYNDSARIAVTLNLAGAHTLTVSVQNITETNDIGVNVLAAAVSKMVIDTQPSGGTGTQNNAPAGIGTVVIRTADAFDNFSTVGLSGTQEVTVSLETGGSGLTATLGGNDDVSISSGEAVFNDLTLNYDGIGYQLKFEYSGTPSLDPVISDLFNMVDVNSYQISLDADDPLVFTPQMIGYGSVTATDVQISNTGGGIIAGLAVTLSGENSGEFIVSVPTSTSLNPTGTATFTVKPDDALGAGSYSAIVTVTADKGISEQFVVNFEVLSEYDITITHGDNEPLDSMNPLVIESLTEGYGELDFVTVTITNTGGTEITGLQVSLGDVNGTAFETSLLSLTAVPVGQTATFGIRPVTALTPGSYNATVTVDDGETLPNFRESFNVQFEVIAYTYTISLDPEGPVDFGIRAEGYAAVTAEEITVTRTGTGDITNLSATLSGGVSSDFEVTGPVDPTLDGTTNSTTFTVSPNSGLSAGFYEETVTVNAENSVVESFTVSFRVVNEVVWEGTTSNWHASGNWSTDAIPDQYAVIRIPSGTSNDPVISGANATVNELVIEKDASLTVNSPRSLTIRSGGKLTVKPGGVLYSTGTFVNNAGSGGLVVESDGNYTGSVIQGSSGVQATVQRYNNVQGWHITSPPVGGEGIIDFLSNSANNVPSNSSGNYAMTHYEENLGTGAGGWGAYYNSSTSGNLIPGRGYLLAINMGHSAYFTGELPYSGKTVTITRGANGWNAIGNPFSSAMRVTSAAGLSSVNFLDINSDEFDPLFAALYVYDLVDNNYKVINNSGGALGLNEGYIQTGQGFMVKSKPGGGSINFTTGMRAHFYSAPFKSVSTSWSTIRLKVSDNNKKSTTLLAFNSNMTKGLDVTYDAGQYGADPGFRLYSRFIEGGNEVDLAIQALPDYDLEGLIIPLGFDFAEGGEVVFSVEELSMPAGASAILEDRYLNKFIDLGKTDYIVSLAENSSGTGRFFVHTDIMITSAEEIPDGYEEQLEIYSYGKEIYILGEVERYSYATLFDLLGRQIKTVKLENGDRNSFRVDELERGIYLVRVSGESTKGAKRVFIE
ncbi:MAG: hypothetical protein ACFCUM_00335 [Bacteroidales bacterium]